MGILSTARYIASLRRKANRERWPWTHVAGLMPTRLGNREVLACGHLGDRFHGTNPPGDLMDADARVVKGARRKCRRCLGGWEQLELRFWG